MTNQLEHAGLASPHIGSLFNETPQFTDDSGSKPLLLAYAITIFISAFLLFQVQPIIGKVILPWFGGMPSVWTTCMLFFQLLLFGGYAYAHLTSTILGPRSQAMVHGGLLLAACLALPILPAPEWKPLDAAHPSLRIVLILSASVGAPFFVLSSTGPLLQNWFARTHSGRSPYRLYALSNVGSLLALISYPVILDYLLPLHAQAWLWSAAFGGFALLCAACAVIQSRSQRTDADASPVVDPSVANATRPDEWATALPSAGRRLLWFLLAMAPSVLLLATTNQVCLDVASVPFLWVLPLILYLLSFILCFDGDERYSRRFVVPCAIASLAAVCGIMNWGATAPLSLQVGVYFLTLFLWAMVCHGELVRLKPHASRLTSFYLTISAGGAAGGIFVALIAPLIFKDYFELHVGLFACGVLLLVVLYSDPASWLFRARPRWAWIVLFAALGTFGTALVSLAGSRQSMVVDKVRDFYGVLTVNGRENVPYDDRTQPTLSLVNGQILHGLQFMTPELQDTPTTYYAPGSAIGLVLSRPSCKPRRVGLVGLGIGTLAAYGRPGDEFRFFEINSKVEDFAKKHFTFLRRCKGNVSVTLGDARLTMDRAAPLNLDVLVLDAFASDAIPVHLLTVEAFEIYRRHMTPQGIIAVHVSNRHFRLRRVVEAVARALKLAVMEIRSSNDARGGLAAEWLLVASDGNALKPYASHADQPTSEYVLWTDDRASLFDVLF